MQSSDHQINDFGAEVRRRRLAINLTLETLAERSGLTPNYIGSVENGKRDPSLSTVLAIGRGLGIPPGELFGGTVSLSAAGFEAGRLLDDSPLEVKKAVLSLLRAVVPLPHQRKSA